MNPILHLSPHPGLRCSISSGHERRPLTTYSPLSLLLEEVPLSRLTHFSGAIFMVAQSDPPPPPPYEYSTRRVQGHVEFFTHSSEIIKTYRPHACV